MPSPSCDILASPRGIASRSSSPSSSFAMPGKEWFTRTLSGCPMGKKTKGISNKTILFWKKVNVSRHLHFKLQQWTSKPVTILLA